MTCLSTEDPACFYRWSYSATTDEIAVVLPDGCADVLVISSDKTGRDDLRSVHWDFSPRRVKLQAGTSLVGYRLRPGTTLNLADLDADLDGDNNLASKIPTFARHDQEVTEIIDALSLPGSRVEDLAKQQGVSERTLQRHFRNMALPTPGFWRQLGRARRAVHALPCRVPLSEIALEFGYSDQAHMTREFVRWFGLTPIQLRRDPAAMSDLAQPGLGNWSGQTASNPAGLP